MSFRPRCRQQQSTEASFRGGFEQLAQDRLRGKLEPVRLLPRGITYKQLHQEAKERRQEERDPKGQALSGSSGAEADSDDAPSSAGGSEEEPADLGSPAAADAVSISMGSAKQRTKRARLKRSVSSRKRKGATPRAHAASDSGKHPPGTSRPFTRATNATGSMQSPPNTVGGGDAIASQPQPLGLGLARLPVELLARSIGMLGLKGVARAARSCAALAEAARHDAAWQAIESVYCPGALHGAAGSHMPARRRVRLALLSPYVWGAGGFRGSLFPAPGVAPSPGLRKWGRETARSGGAAGGVQGTVAGPAGRGRGRAGELSRPSPRPAYPHRGVGGTPSGIRGAGGRGVRGAGGRRGTAGRRRPRIGSASAAPNCVTALEAHWCARAPAHGAERRRFRNPARGAAVHMEGALMPTGEENGDAEDDATGHQSRVRAGDVTSGDVLRVCMGERHGGVTVRWLRRCSVTSSPGPEWEEACPALRIPAAHPDAMVLGACYVPCRREAGGTGGDEVSLVASSAVGAGMECTLRVHEAVLGEGAREVVEGLPATGRGRARGRGRADDAAGDSHGPAGQMRGAAAEPRLAMDLSPSVGHPVNHLQLARSPSGLDTLACVTDGGHIMLVDAATAQTRRAWMAQSGVAYRVAADPTTPGVYVTCGFEPVVRIWDERESPWGRGEGGSRGGRARGPAGRVSPSRCSLALEGHRYRCYDAQWSQDGMRVVTAGGDGFARVFDVRMADAPLAAAQRSFWWLERASFFAGGRGVLAGGGDCRVRCWAASRRDGGLLHAGVLDEHLGAVTGLAVAGGSTVVSAGADGAVAVRTLSPGAVDYSGSGATDESPIRSWKSGMGARVPPLALAGRGSGSGRSMARGGSLGTTPSSSSRPLAGPAPASLGEAVGKPSDSDRGSGSLVSVQVRGTSTTTKMKNDSPVGVRGASAARSPRGSGRAAAGSSAGSTGGLPSTLSWREARAGEQGAADAEQGWLRRLRLAGVTSVSAAGRGRHRMLLEDGRKSFRQPVGWQQGGRGFLHKLGGLPADWGQATPRGDWWGVREWDGGRMGGGTEVSVGGRD